MQKPIRRRQVVNVGGRSLQMVHQTPGVGADVQLHPEMPLVPLLRLVHLRIAGVALVPGRRWRRDDGGVNDAALLQQNSPLGQVIPDVLKQLLRQSVVLQPMAEVEDRRLVRNLLKHRPGKAPDALRLASWSSISGSLRL